MLCDCEAQASLLPSGDQTGCDSTASGVLLRFWKRSSPVLSRSARMTSPFEMKAICRPPGAQAGECSAAEEPVRKMAPLAGVVCRTDDDIEVLR
jgi:hypothetical protein